MLSLSIIIPCYNSEKMLSTVVHGILGAIREKYDYKIILVNDYSRDETWNIISDLCNENHRIIGLNLSRNFGQQAARMAALPYADGDYTIFMDDDGQHPVDGIEKLLLKAEEGYDIVYAYFRDKKESNFKKFGSFVNCWMTNKIMQKPREVKQSSFFVVRKYVVESLKEYDSSFSYLFGYLMQITKNIANVEVTHHERLEGKSGYTFKKLMHLWLDGFIGFSVLPLKISSWLGSLSAIAGFAFALITLIRKLIYPSMPVGYASIIIIILFIGGIILLMLGLIGEYIGRILITLNHVPPYVVKEKLNLK